MTDTAAHISRLEAFFQRRSDDPASVKVVDYEVITGGYSRAMSKVFIEDSSGRRGYIIRADPPPGQAIIDTDRAQEWAVLSTLYDSGVSLLHPHLPNFYLNGKVPKRSGNQHPNICPYDAFDTATTPLFLAVGNNRQYATLCKVLGRPELATGGLFH